MRQTARARRSLGGMIGGGTLGREPQCPSLDDANSSRYRGFAFDAPEQLGSGCVRQSNPSGFSSPTLDRVHEPRPQRSSSDSRCWLAGFGFADGCERNDQQQKENPARLWRGSEPRQAKLRRFARGAGERGTQEIPDAAKSPVIPAPSRGPGTGIRSPNRI
jgi:hypothetical protein